MLVFLAFRENLEHSRERGSEIYHKRTSPITEESLLKQEIKWPCQYYMCYFNIQMGLMCLACMRISDSYERLFLSILGFLKLRVLALPDTYYPFCWRNMRFTISSTSFFTLWWMLHLFLNLWANEKLLQLWNRKQKIVFSF